MTLKGYKPLALLAADEEDLRVVSAVFQDAVTKTRDLAYLPAAKRFAMVANRFVWEDGASREHGPFARARAGLHVDDVRAARFRGLDISAHEAVVDLLAIRFEAGEDGAGTILLTFAGGGEVALDVDAVNVTAQDLFGPWRTKSRPDHDEGG
jgi:hypothetical protein